MASNGHGHDVARNGSNGHGMGTHNDADDGVSGGGGDGGGVVMGDGRRRRLRVLFMHGLETRPHGAKFQALRGPRLPAPAAAAGAESKGGDGGYYYDVRAPSMRGILWPLSKPKGLRHWLVLVALALLAVGDLVGVIALFVRAYYWQAVLLGGGSAVLALWAFRALMRWCVARCLAVQTRALREFQPDVVVGLSFGGALATFLLLRRVWHGPTLLLVPAGSRVQRYAQLRDLPQPLSLDGWYAANRAQGRSAACPIHVVHTPHDRTIPIADTDRVFASAATPAASVTVERVPDRSHALRDWTCHAHFRARIDALYAASLRPEPEPEPNPNADDGAAAPVAGAARGRV